MSAGLELRGFSVDRGGFPIVRRVDLDVPRGSVTVLLGPNGAGKTTLLEGMSGMIPSSGGTITLDGREIRRASRVRRSRLGLGHVEQGRAVFGELTAFENVQVGAADRTAAERALVTFPELDSRRGTEARQLSGGEQQMLVIARALAASPSIVLVDEMSLGLAPVVVRRLMPLWRRLADEGIAVLLVEQFAALALGIGDEAYVLNRGEIVLQGQARDLLTRGHDLRRAYLGGSEDEIVAASPSPLSELAAETSPAAPQGGS
jgi:branched-chain amino acid transport system ATP-binding protein